MLTTGIIQPPIKITKKTSWHREMFTHLPGGPTLLGWSIGPKHDSKPTWQTIWGLCLEMRIYLPCLYMFMPSLFMNMWFESCKILRNHFTFLCKVSVLPGQLYNQRSSSRNPRIQFGRSCSQVDMGMFRDGTHARFWGLLHGRLMIQWWGTGHQWSPDWIWNITSSFSLEYTLCLCQNMYWNLSSIVDLPIENGDFLELCLPTRRYHNRPAGGCFTY